MGDQKKSRFVRIADQAARAYVPVVHTISLLTFIGWFWISGDLRTAALNAIAVLIITCPCALGLAVPAVQIVAAGRLFKKGILIRSGDALERLAKTKSVIFDKTGTLTTGQLKLMNAEGLSDDVIAYAAALSQNSNHPVSRALHDYGNQFEVSDVKEIPGQGLEGLVNGNRVQFGSAKLTNASDIDALNSVTWFKLEDETPIPFEFSDQAREDSKQTVQDLRGMGLDISLLSGDKPHIAKNMAKDLNIEKWCGGVSPKDKMDIIEAAQTEGAFPLMVGDGINDAPALASANASASLATASDISRSASDIILQGDKLSGLPYAINIARKAQKRVVENLGLAIVYNMLAIPLAIFGFVNPLIAALAMSGSSLIVTLNALRMSRA